MNLSKDEIFGIDNSDNLYAKKEGKMVRNECALGVTINRQ